MLLARLHGVLPWQILSGTGLRCPSRIVAVDSVVEARDSGPSAKVRRIGRICMLLSWFMGL